MANKNRFHPKRQKARSPQATVPRPLRVVPERKAPVQYARPFILLEDEHKKTFEYKSGAWVPHALTIAQCREQCEVKALPQQVNGRTRYEIRCPLDINSEPV